MPPPDPAARFSDRVADYVRSRPGYPPGFLDVLRAEAGLTPQTVVADVGSGTGLSAVPFLRNGNVVYAVEPNDGMRAAAEELLAEYPNFHSVRGSAEDTALPDASVDLVVAGQAFHWFDPARARAEFRRILRPDGFVALVWNTFKEGATPFMRAYVDLLREKGTDFKEVAHTNIGRDNLRAFYGADPAYRVMPNEQAFDREGLHSRLRSASYTPPVGHPDHEPMLRALDRLFDEHQEGGRVRFVYDTELYLGRLT